MAECHKSVYTIPSVWDDDKARINRRKHGISFAAAARSFEDPTAISYLDRFAFSIVLLMLVHTSEEANGEEDIRVFPARKASARERALYDSAGDSADRMRKNTRLP